MNEEYLMNLHASLDVEDDYTTWISAVKDNDDYLTNLHSSLDIEDDFSTWKSSVMGKTIGPASGMDSGSESILSESQFSTPSNILGNNIEGDNSRLSFFNKTEELGVLELRELYPDFIFNEKTLGDGGGLDAITVSTKDGKKSASFDVNIDGWNTYGGSVKSKLQGRNKAFDILNDFITENSTQENYIAQGKAKVERRKILTETNARRDQLAAPFVDQIELLFENGNLFNVVEKKVKAFSGYGMDVKFGVQTSEYIKRTQLYEKELTQASNELTRDMDGEKPTIEQIQTRAKSIIINNIQEKMLTSIMSSDDYTMNFDTISKTFLGISYTTRDYSENLKNGKATKAMRYDIAANEFDIDFKKDLAFLALKKQELEDSEDITRLNEISSVIKDKSVDFKFLEGDNLIELKNGKKIPERILNEYISLNEKVNYKINAVNNFSVSVQEKAASYEDNVAAMDISRRNYSGGEEFIVETALGFGELLINTSAGMNLFFGGENKALIEDVTTIKQQIAEIRDSYSKDVEFDDAFLSLGNFASFAAQEVSNQIPIFAALAIPGGMATIGYGSFGDHYINLANERNTEGGRQKSNANIWWSSVGFGASEVVFESLTTLPLIRAAKNSLRSTPGKKTLFDETFQKYFKTNVGKAVYGTLSEPVGEGLTGLSQNLIDGRPLTENLDHMMFSGLMFGTTFSMAPFAKGLYLSKFNDHAIMKDVRKRVDQIKKLNTTNLNIKINLKGNVEGAGSQADIDNNKKIIADLQAENLAEMKEVEANLSGTSNDALKQYFALEQSQEGIKIEAQAVVDNKSLNDQQKTDRLKVLQAKFDLHQSVKDQFRDKDAFGDEYTAFSGLDVNKGRVAEIEKQARSVLNGRGKKDPTKVELFDQAKIIYNTDKINANHAANQRRGLNDVMNAQTKEEAIEMVNKLDINDDVKKMINDQIKAGAHGVNVSVGGKNLPIQIVESMAADDRLETRTHEVGHSVFIKAISKNSKAFDGLANQILEHLKTSNPSAYKRVSFRLGNQKAADEVVMLFLEEVASGKVDIKKSEKAGFFATLMNKGIEEVGGKPVDLRGETDAINFLVGIAKKIKDGTISTKDIANIKANKIAKEAKKSALKTKAEPVAKFSKESTIDINKLGKQIVDEDGNVTNLEEKGGNVYFEVEAENIWKQIQKQGLLDGLILAQPHEGIDNKTFLDTTYTELFSWFKKYQPERKNTSGLFGHINPQIPNRAKQAYNAITKDEIKYTKEIGETTKEGEVKIQVAAEKSTEMEAFESEDLSPAAQAKKKTDKAKGKEKVESKFRRQIGIETGSDLYNKVLDTARKSLLRAYEAGTSVRNIQRKLRDEANVYLFKDIKNFLGTKDYIKRLKEFRVPIMNSIFTADLVQMERNTPEGERVFTRFVKKLTSKADVQAAVDQNLLPASALNIIDKGTAVSLYEKANPTEAQFMSYFDIPTINPKTGARSGTRGTRKDQLAKNMAGSLSYDATMEVAQEPEIAQKRADLAGLNGESLAKDNLEVLAAAIGRDPSIKFSKSNADMGVDILEGKNKNDGYGGKNWQKYIDNPDISNRTKYEVTDEYLKRNAEQNDAISNKELAKLDYFKNGKKRKTKIRTYKKYEIIAKQRAEKIIKDLGLNKQGYVVENLSEKDNNPDIRITRNGKTVLAIEIKGNTARGISVSFNYKKDGKGLTKGKSATAKQETENYNKKEKALIKDSNNVFEEMIASVGKDQITYSPQGNLQVTVEGVKKIKEKGLHLEIYKNKYFITTGDVANSYTQKKGKDGSSRTSHVIEMGNAGMFNMDNSAELSIEGLQNFSDQKALIPLTARISFGKVNKAGTHRTVSIRMEPQLNSMFFDKQNISLINKQGNKNIKFRFSKSQQTSVAQDIIKAANNARTVAHFSKTNGASIFDFDETVGISENFIIAKKGNVTEKIASDEWPLVGETLREQGYEFDFTDFNKVTKGKPGPLLQKMKNQIEKYGPKNVFILTARAPESQTAIHEWLESEGVNIPVENITGLGNSTGEAKAAWVLDKYANNNYNDIYFVDDALQNVKAVRKMLDQLDVKGKSVQAKVKFSKSMNENFNDILENVTGIDSDKRFSIIKGRKRGESKGKFRFFIPPSHEDFVGLLYNFMGKGKEGNKHRDFLEKALVRPLNRGYREIDTAKQAIANDYKTLNKQFPEVKDKLIKTTPDGDFTFQDAIRVYLWNKHGHKIPGLTETDQARLTELVQSDTQLQAYAETLNIISKQENYVAPGQAWETANIRIDLVDATGRVGRADYFTEFQENADVIFSEENLNKIEAAYGRSAREALEDMLHRIKTGVNRPKGASGKPNMFMNWLNASVSGVMFFNTRSALLQQMSNVNFLNFADNNIYAAGKAFANQPQYWKDFAMIFNSDMLKQRRGGLGTDINGAELAEAIKKARPDNVFDQVAIITGKALKLGFLPTQIGDNIAIATGGAAFYRNRVNKLIKDGMSIKEAETAAFTDLQNITQSTQQSARPDMTSQQQASWIGKLVLNFLNTPSQYNRIIKKAGSDIKNRRITPPNTTQTQSDMSNMSRMLYYGAAQNLIFYSLQTALFAVMFGDDDEESEAFLKKKERVINGSIDTILRGSGIYGVGISTLKNMTIKFLEQRGKSYNKDESAVIMEMLNFSPVVGIKARKIVNAEKTLNYNKKVIDEMETFDIDNPQWSAVTNYVEAITTAPVNRIYQKTINLRNAADNDYTAFQRAMFFSGYTTWSLDLGDTEKMKNIKETVKIKSKEESKRKAKEKKKNKKTIYNRR